ncbi:MAG: hypothetical protein LCH96_00005, partial [Actinobacteria bacterium]|nr:hypothetical protein [Actinomycetota bacterium]
MEELFEGRGDGELVAVLDAALDRLTDDRLRVPTDAELLALLGAAVRVEGRVRVWAELLAARVEQEKVAWRAHRTSTSTWLVETGRLTPREAGRLVRAGQGLGRFPLVRSAAVSGVVLAGRRRRSPRCWPGCPTTCPPTPSPRVRSIWWGWPGHTMRGSCGGCRGTCSTWSPPR